MQTLSIYTDIHDSKKLALETKIEKYTKLYTQFSSYETKCSNISIC